MKTIVATALGAALALVAILPASAGTIGDAYDKWTIYSDDTIACIEADAATKLTPGQHAYLVALVDGELSNERSTASAWDLTAGEMIKVQGFAWTAGPNCVLKS